MTGVTIKLLSIASALLLLSISFAEGFTSKEVKCLVCKATVIEMEEAIEKIDPRRRVEVGGFRIDSEGSMTTRTIPYKRSEVYLTELMENICDKMDDYAKAKYKTTGKFTMLKFMVNGGMNPEISNVDFVQDGDLNKSLKHYCLEVLDDFEVPALKFFMKDDEKDIDLKLCGDIAGFCDEKTGIDYNFEDEEAEEVVMEDEEEVVMEDSRDEL